MTPRERVQATIRHEEPDRVPIDLGAMRSTGITAIAYDRLKVHLGIRVGETRVYDLVQQLAEPERMLLDMFKADVVDLGRAFLTDPADWREWPLPNGSLAMVPRWFKPEKLGKGWVVRHADGTIIAAMPEGSLYFNQCHWPFLGVDPEGFADLPAAMGKVVWAALPAAPWHRPLDEAHVAEMGRRARQLREETDYAIMAGFGGNLLEWGEFLCRTDEFLADLVGNRPRVEALLDRLVERHLEVLETFLGAVGQYIDIIQMGDDLGMQDSCMMPPEVYREVFKPRHKILFDYIKKHSKAHVFLHSCGSVYELIPDLIEAGVEILNPVQTSAWGMDPAGLKREFGKDIVFWGGGCDTQRVLPRGTPEEIDAHVKERIETFAPGGGFVFCQVHNIQPDVPPVNVVAMLEAAKKYR